MYGEVHAVGEHTVRPEPSLPPARHMRAWRLHQALTSCVLPQTRPLGAGGVRPVAANPVADEATRMGGHGEGLQQHDVTKTPQHSPRCLCPNSTTDPMSSRAGEGAVDA